jgi:hypothetical protein
METFKKVLFLMVAFILMSSVSGLVTPVNAGGLPRILEIIRELNPKIPRKNVQNLVNSLAKSDRLKTQEILDQILETVPLSDQKEQLEYLLRKEVEGVMQYSLQIEQKNQLDQLKHRVDHQTASIELLKKWIEQFMEGTPSHKKFNNLHDHDVVIQQLYPKVKEILVAELEFNTELKSTKIPFLQVLLFEVMQSHLPESEKNFLVRFTKEWSEELSRPLTFVDPIRGSEPIWLAEALWMGWELALLVDEANGNSEAQNTYVYLARERGSYACMSGQFIRFFINFYTPSLLEVLEFKRSRPSEFRKALDQIKEQRIRS